MITQREHIINYFKSGIKDTKDLKLVLSMKNFYLTKIKIKELITKLYLKCFMN